MSNIISFCGSAMKPGGSAGLVSMFFRAFDGIFLNWTSYVVHIIFPLYLLSSFVENIYSVV